MNEDINRPVFPDFGHEYNSQDLIGMRRIFERFVADLLTTGTLSVERLQYENIPQSGFDLRIGDVYSDNSFLRVVRDGDAFFDESGSLALSSGTAVASAV